MTERCTREADVVEALIDRRRLVARDEDLDAHIATCAVCQEVAMVTRLMGADREQDRTEIRVPAAGQVWWRAAVRARLEAVHAAARPLSWSQGVAAACALGLVMALVGVSWPFIRDVGHSLATSAIGAFAFSEALASIAAPLSAIAAFLQGSITLILVTAACLVLGPLALYVAFAGD